MAVGRGGLGHGRRNTRDVRKIGVAGIDHGRCDDGQSGSASTPLTAEQLVRPVEARESDEAAARLQRRVERVLWSIPERYRWARLDHPAVRALVGPAMDRVDEIMGAARWVVFYGPSWSGKSSFAAACLRAPSSRASRRRGSGRGSSAARNLASAREQHELGSEPPLVQSALNGSLVVIDDVGNEKNTQLNATDDVIADRYDADAVTWITTGLGSKQDGATLRRRGVARRVYEQAAHARHSARRKDAPRLLAAHGKQG